MLNHGTRREKQFGVRLLKKVYDEIYLKSFPIVSEQENFEDWKIRALTKFPKKNDIQTFMIFGFNLSTLPDLVGFIAVSFYKTTSVGLTDYVVRLKKFCHILNAATICAYAEKVLNEISITYDDSPIKMILWEANDPRKINWNPLKPDYTLDCMDPSKRIKNIQEHMHCARIGLSYVQVPVHPVNTFGEIDEGICDTLLLFMYNAPLYQSATPANLEKFITVFSKSLNGHLPNELHHPLVEKMMNELAYMRQKNIPLLYDDQKPVQRKKLKLL